MALQVVWHYLGSGHPADCSTRSDAPFNRLGRPPNWPHAIITATPDLAPALPTLQELSTCHHTGNSQSIMQRLALPLSAKRTSLLNTQRPCPVKATTAVKRQALPATSKAYPPAYHPPMHSRTSRALWGPTLLGPGREPSQPWHILRKATRDLQRLPPWFIRAARKQRA